MLNRVTVVVKNLLIINAIVFVTFFILFPAYKYNLSLYYPGLEAFKPYQIVSHMFMHGSGGHIIFNMLSLFFLGPMVEQRMGSQRFLIFYLLSGFGAMVLHMGLVYVGFLSPNISVVGASGAIMGVFVAFAMYYPNTKLMLLFPPIPVKAKYLMMGLIAFDLFSGVSGMATGIAHFAHLGGVIAGAIMIMMWGK